MNTTQIIDSINAGMYAKNSAYALPFSKEAYLDFVRDWKTVYANLSKASRASKLLRKRSIPVAQRERLAVLAAYEIPTQIGFVSVAMPRTGFLANPVYECLSWKVYARFLLVLRKQLKIEAGKLRALTAHVH